MVNSSYMRILTQYYDSNLLVHSPAAMLAGNWVDPVGPTGSQLQRGDSRYGTEIDRAVQLNGWSNSPDTMFIVDLPPNWYYPDGSCGYHSLQAVGANTYILAGIAWQSGVCQTGPDSTSGLTVVTSHEFAEIVTDPIFTGWRDGAGQEIGDDCSASQPGYTAYAAPAELSGTYVQKLYDNITASCAISLSPTYAYQWAGQAYTPANIAYGHHYAVNVRITNTGNIAWEVGSGGIVRLATSHPANRNSAFSCCGAYGWLSNNRVVLNQNTDTSNINSPVLPGQHGEFNFEFVAPNGQSSTTEYFSPLSEGALGGTGFMGSDTAISWPVSVGTFTDTYVTQTDINGPAIRGNSYMVSVTYRNTGTATWYANEIVHLGTSNPNDRVSNFQDSTWYGSNRPTVCATTTAPGQNCTFTFALRIPLNYGPGTYREYFNTLAEGYAWMPDYGYYTNITVL